MDCRVRIGSTEKLLVRLSAIPLPPDVAEKRRRALRQRRDRRLNPGKEHLFLLGWAIFITNVTDKVWNAKQIQDRGV